MCCLLLPAHLACSELQRPGTGDIAGAAVPDMERSPPGRGVGQSNWHGGAAGAASPPGLCPLRSLLPTGV